ncbi:MAG: general secretion pathway protein GspB [Pseudomonadota bacterium]
MSFILDALKKSESARQDTNSPGIADVPTLQRPPGAPRWILPVAALLGVNLLALLYLVLRSDAAPPPLAKQEPVETPLSSPPRAETTPTASVATRRESTELAGQAAPPPTTRQPVPIETTVTSNTEGTFAATSSESTVQTATPPPATYPAAEQASEDNWLTFADVRASGSLGLPDMHIDLHVFSNNPAERFVFINMTEYRERDTTNEGPTLRSITPEGALLEYRGSTFLLPRD